MIINSGFSLHISPNKDFFCTYEKVDRRNITLDNDDICKVMNTSNVLIKTHDGTIRTLSDMRHILELKKILISLAGYIGC